jgi:hypothetical protein
MIVNRKVVVEVVLTLTPEEAKFLKDAMQNSWTEFEDQVTSDMRQDLWNDLNEAGVE